MTHTDQPSYAPYPNQMPPVQQPKGSNGLATAGFVLGLLGLLGSWIPVLNILGILLGVIGVILAAVGLAKSKKANAGKGLAIAGIILGVLAVVFAVLVNAVFVSAVDEAVKESTKTSVDTSSSGKGSKASGSSADTEIGTSRDNPAPLGSSIKGDNWSVRINSVKQVGQDSMGQSPAAGMTLISINLTATYEGKDAQGETAWATVKFVSPDGTTIDSTGGSSMFIADNEFDSLQTVYEGASVKGDQLLEVPADSWQDGVLAISPSMLSDDTFVAVK
ncbi:DUF4190 domain-containing protein [Nocardioides okcheonensis]|uniref:DUF4190 domain-containing protein n=1 Tax=Nocardioides okcheonensis TaxID=2894081 RepID=UPI001E2C294B|nr:DUF4190 domain-containing protein [Nocardioides okcheonensis]UFN43363.1 DUF4190 domain-containing protein [Nocardioides okcheonensis]